MNTIIQTDVFSFARFKAVLANDIATQSRIIIKAISIAFFIFFIVEALSLSEYFRQGFKFHDVAYHLSNLFPLTLAILSTVMCSLILSDCRRKETRIAVIMLPARQSEKYLSRITVCLLGILAGVLLHITLYYLFLGLHFAFQSGVELPENMSQPWQYLNPFGFHGSITSNGREVDIYDLTDITTVIFIGIWISSCYILGGTVWKKGSWLLTSAVLLAALIITVGMTNDNHSATFFLNATTFSEDFIINIIICTALTALNIRLSYFLFKRMQVTQKKLFSIKGLRRHK